MDYNIVLVKEHEKDILYKLLQFALYDGSQYIENELNTKAEFEYTWFNNYFTDNDRDAYFIKIDSKFIGIVMVNENLKFLQEGKCIAEFFVFPQFRRKHLGKKVAFDIFDKYKVNWEVQPMENNPIAYSFWKNIINEYTNGNYKIKNNGIEDVFIFQSRKMVN